MAYTTELNQNLINRSISNKKQINIARMYSVTYSAIKVPQNKTKNYLVNLIK